MYMFKHSVTNPVVVEFINKLLATRSIRLRAVMIEQAVADAVIDENTAYELHEMARSMTSQPPSLDLVVYDNDGNNFLLPYTQHKLEEATQGLETMAHDLIWSVPRTVLEDLAPVSAHE